MLVGSLHVERASRGGEAGDLRTVSSYCRYICPGRPSSAISLESGAAVGARAARCSKECRKGLADHERRSGAIRDTIDDRAEHADTRLLTSSTTRRTPGIRIRASTAMSCAACFPSYKIALEGCVMERRLKHLLPFSLVILSPGQSETTISLPFDDLSSR